MVQKRGWALHAVEGPDGGQGGRRWLHAGPGPRGPHARPPRRLQPRQGRCAAGPAPPRATSWCSAACVEGAGRWISAVRGRAFGCSPPAGCRARQRSTWAVLATPARAPSRGNLSAPASLPAAILKAVEEGHDVNEVEAAGNTPLHFACYEGWLEGCVAAPSERHCEDPLLGAAAAAVFYRRCSRSDGSPFQHGHPMFPAAASCS